MPKRLTVSQERDILTSSCTRKLVFEVLKLAETRDCLDASRDVELASKILAARVDRLLKPDMPGSPGWNERQLRHERGKS